MRSLKVTRPTQVDVDDAFPVAGKARNIVSSGDNRGTPWIEDVINDRNFGWQENILKRAGVVANNIPEDGDNSQIAEAISIVSAVAAQGKNLEGSTRYGCTLNSEDDWVIHTDGSLWEWAGAYPKTVISGDTPASPDYHSVSLGNSTTVNSGINLRDYNITSAGDEVNDFTNLKTAIDEANASGKEIFGGRDLIIKLTGSSDILINTDVDFGGATIDISEWGGKFIIENATWNTYEAGTPAFDNLLGTGILSSDKVNGWETVPELNNCYIKINSSNYHYTYREIHITQTEYNVCTNRGKLLSLVGDMNTDNITNVQALPLNLKKQTFGNLNLMIGSKTLGDGFLKVINSNRVKLHDISIDSDDIIFSTINPNFIDLFDCAFIEVENVEFNRPFQADTPDRFAYGIRMEYCYDARFTRLRGYGEGWGLLGSNSSRNIFYDSCDVNRIDFHKPLVELLQLTNCKIGSWGMLLTTLGDVKIDKCTFLNNSTDYFGQRAYIAANDSAGGFANGDLIITNSKFRSADKQLMLLYVNKANPTGGVRFPSSIEKQCWNRVIVENCDFGYGYQTALMPGIEDDNGMRWPSEVVFRDCTGDCLISRNLVKSLPRYTITDDETDLNKPHNLFITIDNVETVYDSELYIGDRRDQNFKIKANLNNIRATNNSINSGVTLSLVFGGDVSITNSLIEGFNFLETNPHYKPLNIMIDTSTINYIGRLYDEMFKDPAPRSAITASNCVFIASSANVADAARIKTVGCKMKINTSPNFYDSVTVTDTVALTINNGSSAFKNANYPVNWNQDVDIVISVGTSGAYSVRVNLAEENINKTIPINAGYIQVRRVGVGIEITNNIGAATNLYFYYVSKIL